MGASGRAQKREETRLRVYRAALAVFRRESVLSASIETIAREAGVSRGTFYFHFPTKDDVLLMRMRETETEVCAALAAVPAEASLRTVLDAVAAGLAAAWEKDPSLLVDVAQAALRLTSRNPLDQASTDLRQALSDRFRAAHARGELHPLLPAEFLSDIFLGNALGGMLAWYGRPAGTLVGLRVVLEGVARLFLDGASPR